MNSNVVTNECFIHGCTHERERANTLEFNSGRGEVKFFFIRCAGEQSEAPEIIKRRNKQRLAKAAALAKKEAAGDFSHLKNKKGEFIAKPLPQPTLPNLSVDDDIDTSFFNNDRRPSATVRPANRPSQPANAETTPLAPTTMVVGYSHVSP